MNTERLKVKVSVIVLLIKDNLIFMFKRKNTGWEDGKYNPPTGHVDQGELPTQTAVRELKEETGIDINSDDLKLTHVDFIKDSIVNFTFIAKNWSGEPKISEVDKAEDGRWFKLDDLPQNIAGHGRQILENLNKNEIYLEID